MIGLEVWSRFARTYARAVFAAALILAFAVAVSPAAVGNCSGNFDKIAHGMAFYGLSLLGALCLPRIKLGVLAALMVTYGALIEVVQGLPMVGRDASGGDLIADALGMIMALMPIVVARFRWHEISAS